MEELELKALVVCLFGRFEFIQKSAFTEKKAAQLAPLACFHNHEGGRQLVSVLSGGSRRLEAQSTPC